MHKGLDSIGRGYGTPMSLAIPTFQSGVSFPNQPLPPAVVEDLTTATSVRVVPPDPPQKIRDLISQRYFSTKPLSPEREKEMKTLFAKASEIAAELDDFLERVEEEWRSKFKKDHVAVRALGRQQKTIAKKLYEEFIQADLIWQSNCASKTEARNGVLAANHQRSHLNRFASDETIEKADKRIEEAKVAAREAQNSWSDAMAERNRLENELAAARAELHRLALEEHRLRCQIEGRAYRDPELGLMVNPV